MAETPVLTLCAVLDFEKEKQMVLPSGLVKTAELSLSALRAVSGAGV